MSEQLGEFRVSNDILDDPIELRRRVDEEGYLFFKRLQDPDWLWDLRRDMLSVIEKGGWLEAGTDPIDGIADISGSPSVQRFEMSAIPSIQPSTTRCTG